MLRLSSDIFEHPGHAMKACVEYLQSDPDDLHALTMRVTIPMILYRFTVFDLDQGEALKDKTPNEYEAASNALNLMNEPLPPYMTNGLLLEARIGDADKRTAVAETIEFFGSVCSGYLDRHLHDMQQETDGLLVDGQTRALVEKKTLADTYNDAETYFAAFQSGDVDGAGQGFRYLKELNPKDAYFRNVLGVIRTKQGRSVEALREFLFGVYLDPVHPHLTLNLVRELAALALYGAVLEVCDHYRQQGDRDRDPTSYRGIEMYSRLARAVTCGVACCMAGVESDDFSNQTANLLETPPVTERRWLPQPRHLELPLVNKRVFISYRRVDGTDAAMLLRSKLKILEPSMDVFLDREMMKAGRDFTEQIRRELQAADLLILLIGPYWSSTEGRKRLNEPDDILRQEIALVLEQGIPVLPVLIDGARMPSQRQLPKGIRIIAKLHAEEFAAEPDEGLGSLSAAMIRLLQESGRA